MLTNPAALNRALGRLRPLLEAARSGGEAAPLAALRDTLYQRYRTVFTRAAANDLDTSAFLAFLAYKNNKRWSTFERQGARLTQDPVALGSGLRTLLDAQAPLDRRFASAVSMVSGMGPALASVILHVTQPTAYAIWNRSVADALTTLLLLPACDDLTAAYADANAILVHLARELDTDLWTLDSLWWRVLGKAVPGDTVDQAVGHSTPAYLLTWNPNRWEWSAEDVRATLARVPRGEARFEGWSTGNSKRLMPGDRVYLVKLGNATQGLFASGRAVSPCYEGLHWDPVRAAEHEMTTYVDLALDEMLDPAGGTLLPLEQIKSALPHLRWSPPAACLRLDEASTPKLERLWQEVLFKNDTRPLTLASSEADVRASLETFAHALEAHADALHFALFQQEHFIYDPITDAFAPAKWCALQGMSMDVYVTLQQLQRQHGSFRGFDGARAHAHLEHVLGQVCRPDAALAKALAEQLQRIYGTQVLDNPTLDTLRFGRLSARARQVWWVNQGRTYEAEHTGGYLWAPLKNKRGQSVPHWDAVAAVRQGDILLCCHDKAIRAIGCARSDAEVQARPTNLADLDDRQGDGWFAEVDYVELTTPVPLEEVAQRIAALGLEGTPVQPSGAPKPGYLFALADAALDFIVQELVTDELPPLVRDRLGLDAAAPGLRPAASRRQSASNVIFSGPSGCGKTQRAIEEAVRLCDGALPSGQRALMTRLRGLQAQRRITLVAFHPRYDYEAFVEARGAAGGGSTDGVFKKLCRVALANPSRAHVCIIDDLNRGDVAAIFGDLMTLIDTDKRLGTANALQITLPYSGEEFGVPANVHLVATMGTTASCDAQLRRRFRCIALQPDPAVLRHVLGERTQGVDVARILQVLNARIAAVADREHCVGHAYFLGVKSLNDLRQVFVENVIPLLRDHFHEDDGKLRAVLGCGDTRTGRNAFPVLHDDAASRALDTAVRGQTVDPLRQPCGINPAFAAAESAELEPFFAAMLLS